VSFQEFRARINADKSSIKTDLFHNIVVQIVEVISPFIDTEIADDLHPIVRRLTNSAASSPCATYLDLNNFLTLNGPFKDMAAGCDPRASRVHFSELVAVLEGIINLNGVRLSDEQTLRLRGLLNAHELHNGRQ
jgi:hypothetical protein